MTIPHRIRRPEMLARTHENRCQSVREKRQFATVRVSNSCNCSTCAHPMKQRGCEILGWVGDSSTRSLELACSRRTVRAYAFYCLVFRSGTGDGDFERVIALQTFFDSKDHITQIEVCELLLCREEESWERGIAHTQFECGRNECSCDGAKCTHGKGRGRRD